MRFDTARIKRILYCIRLIKWRVFNGDMLFEEADVTRAKRILLQTQQSLNYTQSLTYMARISRRKQTRRQFVCGLPA